MRRAVTARDIHSFANLDMIYNQIRVLEAKQNETEFKCKGSGECCKIGLTIPLAECANIAFRLRQQYYLHLENTGRAFADEWMDSVVKSLLEAMHDESWQIGGETKRHCAFYKGGCTIYGYRPMVCRTFGTITTVDDYCPRARNQYGSIDYFAGDAVKGIIQSYQNFLKDYATANGNAYDMVVYLPLGVLSFLLETKELEELEKNTDDKFWKAVEGWFNYRVEFTKKHGHDYDHLESESVAVGLTLRFPKNDTVD
jgi:Fe-S-cluster containining protein